MKDQIASVQSEALARIAEITDMKGLEDARVGILGKKGSLTQVQQGMRNVPKEEKPAVGAMLNEARAIITAALEDRKATLQAELDAAAVAGVDVTMPGATLPSGGLHPISIVRDEAVRVLRRMGFTLSDGPEIEYD